MLFVMDPRLSLRPATPADRSAVLSMVNAMADTDKMPRLDPMAQDRLMQDAFQRKKVEFVLAEWEGKAIGYAAIFESYSTFEARPTLFLDDLFVLPEYRGRHAAYELFRYCIQQAKKRECGRMEWLVMEGNNPAFGFYDHLQAKRLKNWVPFRLNHDDIQKMG
jgi:GNAT superfamily N-acetyltransferase